MIRLCQTANLNQIVSFAVPCNHTCLTEQQLSIIFTVTLLQSTLLKTQVQPNYRVSCRRNFYSTKTTYTHTCNFATICIQQCAELSFPSHNVHWRSRNHHRCQKPCLRRFHRQRCHHRLTILRKIFVQNYIFFSSPPTSSPSH